MLFLSSDCLVEGTTLIFGTLPFVWSHLFKIYLKLTYIATIFQNIFKRNL